MLPLTGTFRSETVSKTGLTELSLAEACEVVRHGKVSPVDLTKACLERIEQLNPALNAFVTVTAEEALEQARKAEADIHRGDWICPLHGIPIALKDLVDTRGVRTTAASGVFKDRVPTEDAEIVRRLKAAGAVLLGKLNLHEFAYGASSVISEFGPIRNPWASEYCTGGSSGGSAAAVAAGLCYGAIGSDTGGSIRIPAAWCGVIGLKPTYGRVSTRGVIPLAWSLDHLGPMTRTVSDAALMLQAISGYDSEDPASTDTAVPDYARALTGQTASLRIGIPRAHFYEALHPEIASAINAALSALGELTSSHHEIEVSVTTEIALRILKAEAFAYHRDYVAKTPELYQPETLQRIRAGAEISTAEYIDARREMDQLRRSVPKLFEAVDLVVTPTVPMPPPKIQDLVADTEGLRAKEVLMTRNTRPFNLLGLPTISVPCGLTETGLPIGLQITGPPGGEAAVLWLAHAFERTTQYRLGSLNSTLTMVATSTGRPLTV